MPQALQERPRSSAVTSAGSASPEGADASTLVQHSDAGLGYPSIPAQQAAVSKLTMLLEADPVSLAAVGDAIRAHPALETSILQLCESLALTFGVPVGSAEEAAIVLGKDRLRILVRAWSSVQFREPSRGGTRAADMAGARDECHGNDAASGWLARPATPDMTPEALYLANFLRCVGADLASLVRAYAETNSAVPNFAAEPSAGLTNILARDLLFLMPFVGPMMLTPEQRAALQEMLQFCR